jgi:hypothetical protein
MRYYAAVAKMVETKIFGKGKPSIPPKPSRFVSGSVWEC